MARKRSFLRLRVVALTAICSFGLAACGDEEEPGTIPPDSAEGLVAQLDQIETAVEAGDCDTAQSLAVGFAQNVNGLPGDVDPKVREKLVEAAGNLEGQTGTQCTPADEGASGETGETDTTEPPVTAPAPESEPEPEEPPADDDSGNGQGPPEETPGNGDPGGGNSGGGSSSGGVGNG